MTAFATRPLHESARTGGTADTALLRFALRADATVCAAVGLLGAMVADPLARLAGLTATAGWLVGAALVSYGALLYALAALPDIRRVGTAVFAGNVAFGAVAVTAVLAGWLPLTALGTDLLLGFVAITLGLAWLQYRGVRRLA
ncbi:hypothetical protein [Mycolicibacterium brisbanense]|uniref:Uncharacterized protein n=1 Tax=Mycolicibacterium brisbanense TaxID=146020 RepID=A0A117I6R8_9MYCO|nr:hypothetical protein [Mycolicibacterium brisbanense]MCV7158513.1 hypothetical protein [Mycolicibacterium brisbanense]GAS90435.1 uncharacterized protein RMCB_4531 [Mycolicibacterium brisbanense]